MVKICGRNGVVGTAGPWHLDACPPQFLMWMGPKTPVAEGEFLRQPQREQINLKHPMLHLTDLIKWERLGASTSGSFVSGKGRSG